MQQTLSQIADKWQADGEWIRPVNSVPERIKHPVFGHDVVRGEAWRQAEIYAKQHRFSTNLTGVFHVSELAEPVWQYQTRLGVEWDDWDEKEAEGVRFTSFQNFRDYMYDLHDCATRQYVTTKQP